MSNLEPVGLAFWQERAGFFVSTLTPRLPRSPGGENNKMIARSRWWLVTLLWVVLVSPPASAQGTAWERHMAAGVKAYRQGRYADAEKPFQAAVKEAEGFEPQDPRLAMSLNNLAVLYRHQGQYAKAESLYKRALVIREKALGPNHPHVTQSLENYADLLRNMYRESEAEKMEARAKAIRAKYARENPTK